MFIRQLQILGSTGGDLAEFRDLLAFVERHGIVPVIDSEFALERATEALARLESGHQFGKIALNIN